MAFATASEWGLVGVMHSGQRRQVIVMVPASSAAARNGRKGERPAREISIGLERQVAARTFVKRDAEYARARQPAPRNPGSRSATAFSIFSTEAEVVASSLPFLMLARSSVAFRTRSAKLLASPARSGDWHRRGDAREISDDPSSRDAAISVSRSATWPA